MAAADMESWFHRLRILVEDFPYVFPLRIVHEFRN
jgi:hypothetical protein